MTVAICLKCGARKVGALVACASCQFDPHTSSVDSAKSILLSDHHMDAAGLAAVAKLIQEGGAPAFPEAKLDEMARAIGAVGTGMPTGCLVAVWTPIVVLVALVGALLYMFTR